MITFRLTQQDLTQVRFAYSPLLELVTSFALLSRSDPDPRYRVWMDEARRATYNHDFPYMSALIPPRRYIPDFLTPTPLTTHQTIEEELAQVLATPEAIVRKYAQVLMNVHGETEIRRHFVVYPRDAMYCLVEEMRLHWQLTLDRHWARIANVLDDEILYRARVMALEGTSALFTELDELIRYQSDVIYINKPNLCAYNEADVELRGTGVQLVPTMFCGECKVMWQFSPEWQPMVMYIPRGTGLWWKPQSNEPEQALELTLGAGRARVLTALINPLTTGELARNLRISAGATSQHLSRLHQAGLVASNRSGKRVYYHLTPRGEGLLMLFSTSSMN